MIRRIIFLLNKLSKITTFVRDVHVLKMRILVGTDFYVITIYLNTYIAINALISSVTDQMGVSKQYTYSVTKATILVKMC